jgi:beta-glucosidase
LLIRRDRHRLGPPSLEAHAEAVHRITPLFPFGFGLSSTTFSFSNPHVTPSVLPLSRSAVATLDLTNTRSVAGAETVQISVADPASTDEPLEQLEGLARVTLTPGQTARWPSRSDPAPSPPGARSTRAWVAMPGRYRVMVGDCSTYLPLVASVSIG